MSEVTAQEPQIGSEAEADQIIASAVREQAQEAAAGTPGIDMDAIVSKVLDGLSPKLNTLLDKRMGGFQQLLETERSEKAEMAARLREFEVAGLSEDERAQLAQEERDEEVERLRLENELYRLAGQHPKGAALYQRLIEPGLTAAQQVALLDELLTGSGSGEATPSTPTPTPQPTPAAATGAVPVDHNNPGFQVPPDAEVLENGEIMTDEIADRILRTERWQPA